METGNFTTGDDRCSFRETPFLDCLLTLKLSPVIKLISYAHPSLKTLEKVSVKSTVSASVWSLLYGQNLPRLRFPHSIDSKTIPGSLWVRIIFHTTAYFSQIKRHRLFPALSLQAWRVFRWNRLQFQPILTYKTRHIKRIVANQPHSLPLVRFKFQSSSFQTWTTSLWNRIPKRILPRSIQVKPVYVYV